MDRGSSPPLAYATLPTPIGALFVAARGASVCRVALEPACLEENLAALARRYGCRPEHLPGALAGAAAELRAYLEGRLRIFSVEADLTGVTPFQAAVLEATAEIPWGRVATYGEIAGRIGRPRAARAVGNALNANPVPLIIPCHRVVASSGLGGFGGGVGLKRRLLRMEGRL